MSQPKTVKDVKQSLRQSLQFSMTSHLNLYMSGRKQKKGGDSSSGKKRNDFLELGIPKKIHTNQSKKKFCKTEKFRLFLNEKYNVYCTKTPRCIANEIYFCLWMMCAHQLRKVIII